jgi:putative DNA primase/helicase
VAGSTDVPSPDKIDPTEFYQKRGKREVFVVALMAKYLAILLGPICHTDGIFYRYDNGLWAPFKKTRIHTIVHHALKDRVQTAWYKNSCEALAALTNREEDEWVQSDTMVNLANGIYDLDKSELIPHHPKFGCRSQVPTAYSPQDTCPRWKQFLNEIFEGDIEKQLLLQEYLGYVLMPTCRFEKALFMYGSGANGKSTVIKILEIITGKTNISHLTLEDLSNRFQIAYLKGKMVNMAAEVDTTARAGTEVLKMAISGDTLEGDQKFGQRITFQSQVKFIFAMNSPPVIADKAHGFSRKVIVLNFARRFIPEEMDRNLINKLIAEKEGILAWMLDGAKRLIQNEGFIIGQGIEKATHSFMASMNPVLAFLEERCCHGPECKVPAPMLFGEYKTWSAESAHKPLSKSRFYEQIINLCDHVKEKQRIDWGVSRPWGFVGVGLADS